MVCSITVSASLTPGVLQSFEARTVEGENPTGAAPREAFTNRQNSRPHHKNAAVCSEGELGRRRRRAYSQPRPLKAVTLAGGIPCGTRASSRARLAGRKEGGTALKHRRQPPAAEKSVKKRSNRPDHEECAARHNACAPPTG